MGWDAYAATMARRGAANAEAIVVFTFEITFAVIDAYEIYENAYCLGLRRVRGPSIDPLQPHRENFPILDTSLSKAPVLNAVL